MKRGSSSLQALLPVFLLFAASSAQGAVIIGNLPETNDNAATFLVPGNAKGIGFTMTGDDLLSQAILRLSSTNAAHAPIVTIMDSASGLPSTVLATFQNPALGLGTANYIFSLSTSLSLQNGSTYWLVMTGNETTSDLIWQGSNPNVTPTGPGATFEGALFGFGTLPDTPSIVINSFQLNGAEIPEPSTWFAVSGGLAALLFLRSRAAR